MDFMQMLRMRNIFGPQQDPSGIIGNDLPSQGGITGTMSQPSSPPSAVDFGMSTIPPPQSATPAIASDPTSGYDAGARMAELYHPDTTAEDRFNSMVGSYPQHADYHPSKLRMLGGMLAAVGNSFDPRGRGFRFNPQAIEFGRQTIDKPYDEKLTDWKNQIGPAQTAANLEKANNINERTLAYQTVSQELRQHAQEAKDKNDARNADIREHRANVYEYKALHPNAKFDFTGATVKVADPATGKVEDLGVPTGHMTKLDQLNLQHENTMKEIGARTSGAIQVEGVRQGGRESIAETRGWKLGKDEETGKSILYNEITGETKPVNKNVAPFPRPSAGGGGGNKPPTPQQTRIDRFNAAAKIFNTDPTLKKFIRLGSPGSNDFQVIPPADPDAWFTSGHPSKQQYDDIQRAIYGGTSPDMAASHTPTNTPNLGTEPPARTSSGKTGDLTDKAKKFLTDNGLPITQANIDHAIKTKRVQ